MLLNKQVIYDLGCKCLRWNSLSESNKPPRCVRGTASRPTSASHLIHVYEASPTDISRMHRNRAVAISKVKKKKKRKKEKGVGRIGWRGREGRKKRRLRVVAISSIVEPKVTPGSRFFLSALIRYRGRVQSIGQSSPIAIAVRHPPVLSRPLFSTVFRVAPPRRLIIGRF